MIILCLKNHRILCSVSTVGHKIYFKLPYLCLWKANNMNSTNKYSAIKNLQLAHQAMRISREISSIVMSVLHFYYFYFLYFVVAEKLQQLQKNVHSIANRNRRFILIANHSKYR